MNNKDNQELLEQFEKEAGVAELAALYERIESVYVKASQISGEDPPVTVSNSTNTAR